jgi:hypothetical protein
MDPRIPANGKPYNQMATELISTAADNSWDDGRANFLVGSVLLNGAPTQDNMDQMTADTFETFMGMSHVNCVLCHNGRGHLDGLSLWGQGVTRYQSWQLAAFLSRTSATRTLADPAVPNIFYWSLLDNQRNFQLDYTLNTTTGNRPARVAPTGCKSGQPCVSTFRRSTSSTAIRRRPERATGRRWLATSPAISSSRELPSTICGPTISDAASWIRLTLSIRRGWMRTIRRRRRGRSQPSNAKLLNALAQHFVDSGYNVKSIMREIVNSDAYQLSSRYEGEWNPANEPYFARKYVRRLWGEEILDAMTQSSGTYPSYTVTGLHRPGSSAKSATPCNSPIR